jgi:hypothetical protein
LGLVFLLFSSLLRFLAAAGTRNHKTLGALGGIKKDFQQIQTRERGVEDAARTWPYGFLSSFFST